MRKLVIRNNDARRFVYTGEQDFLNCSGGLPYFPSKNYNYFGDKEALLAKISIEYTDGSRDIVVTDTENWKCSGDGPYRYAGLFMGEQYNAERREVFENYSKRSFNDESWVCPVENMPEVIEESCTMPSGFGRSWPALYQNEMVLEGWNDAPVYIVDRRRAQNRIQQGEKLWVYDLGQEMAGVPRIRFCEKKGTKITIRYAEMLYPNLEKYKANQGRIMLENYRDAASTDIYVCAGSEDGEVYQPRFTFHGYRYIEISGVSIVHREMSEWDGREIHISSAIQRCRTVT